MTRVLIGLLAMSIVTLAAEATFALSPARYEIFFASGETTISMQGDRTLRSFADTFKQMRRDIIVSGHTDSAEASEPLSWARAEAVKRRLVQLGISADRIFLLGYGDTMPLQNAPLGGAEPINRRVQIYPR